MSEEHRNRSQEHEEHSAPRPETEESEERAMSVFASERREDILGIIIGFAIAFLIVLIVGTG